MKSLVLVLGAGASKEVKLPVGVDLKAQIAAHLDIRFDNGYSQCEQPLSAHAERCRHNNTEKLALAVAQMGEKYIGAKL